MRFIGDANKSFEPRWNCIKLRVHATFLNSHKKKQLSTYNADLEQYINFARARDTRV